MKRRLRLLILIIVFLIYGIVGMWCNAENAQANTLRRDASFKTSDEVLERLQRGNDKYVKSNINDSKVGDNVRRELYENGQHPYAIILSCVDSRVVPENIFYTGPGEILVTRVAGNVVDDSILGTIEFAVDQKKVPLIVVMGHENCGVIQGALKGNIFGKLGKIISQVVPSVEKAKLTECDDIKIFNKAVELNVENSIRLINENEIVKRYIDEGKVKVVGANYNLETGKVKWLKSW